MSLPKTAHFLNGDELHNKAVNFESAYECIEVIELVLSCLLTVIANKVYAIILTNG